MTVEYMSVRPNVYLHWEDLKQEPHPSERKQCSGLYVSYLLTKYLCILRYISAKQERIKKAGHGINCNDTDILYYNKN